MKKLQENQNIVIVFIDTDILMHFHKLDLIPWNEILNADKVKIVLVPLNFDQLEEKHFDQNPITRERAETAKKEIKSFLNDEIEITLKDGVILSMVIQEENRKTPGLSEDNRLLDSIQQYQTEHTKVFITNDYLFRQRVKAKGIVTVELDEKYKRKFKDDSKTKQITKLIKDNEQLRKEIEERDAKEPILDLRFTDGKRDSTQNIVNPGGIRAYAKRLRERRIPHDEVGFAKNIKKAEDRCTMILPFILNNMGGTPAEDVEIKLNIQLSPELFKIYLYRKTKSGSVIIKHSKKTPNCEIITEEDAFIVQYKHEKLKHSKSMELNPIAIYVEDWLGSKDIDSFIIEYMILADNIRQPVTGILCVIVEREETPLQGN